MLLTIPQLYVKGEFLGGSDIVREMSTVLVDKGNAWLEALDTALHDADIPTLLMVLIQLTGDTSWLSPRFQCQRVQASPTTAQAASGKTSAPR